MATPQYPAILTEADWKKNKPKTIVGADLIGKQLGLVAAVHKGTLWQLFDLRKMPPTGDDKAADIQAALDRATAEYDKNVKLLLGRLKVLEDEVKKQQGKAKTDYLTRLAAAITQYAAQAQLVQAEFKVFEAARDAAQLAQGEDEGDETETDEAESLDPEKNKPVLVKDVIGRPFFVYLETISFYRDDDVRRWTEDPSLLLSPKDNRPINDLKDAQARGVKALLAFRQAFNELRTLGDAWLAPAQGIKKTKLAWKKARAAFDQPGFKVGAYAYYERKQVDALGQGVVDEWKRQNSAPVQLHRKVGDLLAENLKIINNLESLLQKAKVK